MSEISPQQLASCKRRISLRVSQPNSFMSQELQGLVRRINSKLSFVSEGISEELSSLSAQPVTPTETSSHSNEAPWFHSSVQTLTFFQSCSGTSLADYEVGNELGRGLSGCVRYALLRQTQQGVALKAYERSKMLDIKHRDSLMREVQVLRNLDHPNIVKLYDQFNTSTCNYLVLEYVSGGSLRQYLRSRKKLTEAEARPLFRQIVEAVAYCHSQSVVHGDIKAENVLLDQQKVPKVIDFGLASCVVKETKLKSWAGTLPYMAPEIIGRKPYHGQKSDVWALGVLLFFILVGEYPFKGTNETEVRRKIQRAKFICPGFISNEAKAILEKMLDVQPDKRLRAESLLGERWFMNSFEEEFSELCAIRD